MEHRVKALTGGIPTWVVRCGCGLLNSVVGIQMLQDRILKRLAFVTMYSGRYSVDIEPLSTIFFAMVRAFWFGVTNAWLNLEKTSVRTRTFFLPSLDGSMVVKSTQRRSNSPLAIIEPGCDLGHT